MLEILLLCPFVTVTPGSPQIEEYVRAHCAADAALVAGDTAAALSGFRRCLELSPENSICAYGTACAEARAGNDDSAIRWLRRAADWGYTDTELVRWDRDCEALRELPEFSATLKVMQGDGLKTAQPLKFAGIYDSRSMFCTNDVAIDSTGRFVAAGTTQGTILVLDARTGQAVCRSPVLGSALWSIAFAPGGDRLLALTWDGRLHTWPVDGSASPISAPAFPLPWKSELGWPFGAVLQFDPTGKRLLVAGRDRGGSLWTSDGTLIHKWEEPLGNFFSVPIAWTADGGRIALGRKDRVEFFDGGTGHALPEEDFGMPSLVDSLAFHSSGGFLATGHEDNRIRLWSWPARELLFEREYSDRFEPQITVNAVSFSPNGRLLAGGTGSPPYLDVFNVATGKRLTSHDAGGAHFAEPYEMCWSGDSRRLWFAFCCGSMPVAELRLEPDLAQSISWYGRAPKLSHSGLAVSTAMASVLLFDSKGSCLWSRPNLLREGELLQTATGYFTADFDRFDGLEFYGDHSSENGRALWTVAEALFDPKRVRASRAGVRLKPPRL